MAGHRDDPSDRSRTDSARRHARSLAAFMALLLCFVALIFFASCEQPTAQKSLPPGVGAERRRNRRGARERRTARGDRRPARDPERLRRVVCGCAQSVQAGRWRHAPGRRGSERGGK
jgi:hypothetical protein